jgi:serine/threonine protein kinase
VIHRDIKPENVVLEGGQWGGRVFLIDFGGVQGSAGLGKWDEWVPTEVPTETTLSVLGNTALAVYELTLRAASCWCTACDVMWR